MSDAISPPALHQLFDNARTFNAWQTRDVPDELLHKIYDSLKFGPTSANGSPARITFVKSKEGKARLAPALSEGNLKKTMAAPVTAIVAHDLEFYEHMPKLFPQTDAKSWFVGKPDFIASTAFRNGTLQGAYLIIAARAMGLDCGPMSGFDNAKVDAEFFAGTQVKSNFLINLGYGDPQGVFPRNPRFAFDEVCKVV